MEGFRQVANHHGTIRCLFRSKYRSEFFSCGDDKKIIQWQVDSRMEPKVANYWNLDAIPFFGQVHDSGFFFRISKYQEKKGHMEIWRTDGHGDFSCWQRFASKGQTKVEFVILNSKYVLVTHGLATQLYTISGGTITIWFEKLFTYMGSRNSYWHIDTFFENFVQQLVKI